MGDLELLQTLNLERRWDSTSRQWFTNTLVGPIPDELGRLENLVSLSLGWNGLTGRIPDALGNLSNLRSLSLYGNGLAGLTGPIPSSLGRLSNLTWLDLALNRLTGRHDRYAQLHSEIGRGPVTPDPAFGYVNQPGLAAGAAPSRRWRTIMAYGTQCADAYTSCPGCSVSRIPARATTVTRWVFLTAPAVPA